MKKVMKNSLLSLIWVITLLPCTAQHRLSPGLQSHLDRLNPKLIKPLTMAGFDATDQKTRLISSGAQSRSGELRLDSTKTFVDYNHPFNSDSTPQFRTLYAYPSEGVQVQTDYQLENNDWKPIYRTTIFSDQLDRVIQVLSDVYDENTGAFVPESQAVVFPHKDSPEKIDSFFAYEWDPAITNWSFLLFTKNQYDAQDRLAISISSLDFFGQPLLLKDVYSYDANGDNTLVDMFILANGQEAPSGKRESEFQNHLVLQETAYTFDGNDFTPITKTAYEYNNINKAEVVNAYEWEVVDNNWRATQRDIYGYDNAERVNSREEFLFYIDGSEERYWSKYAYVESDKLALEENYFWDGGYILNDRKFYYYGEVVSAVLAPEQNALTLEFSPNPSRDFVNLNLKAPATLQVFNLQGKMLRSAVYQPNQVVDISALPSGTYVLAAQTESERYVGRVLKNG